MARKRMVDPSFWVDEKLGTVDVSVRLLFMGLISQADDEGRLNGHSALIRSLIFPYDQDITVSDVEGWLQLLAADGRKLIIRYEVDHQQYICIPNFKKHQTINKPQDSKLPKPPNDDYGTDTEPLPQQSVPKEGKLKEVKGREEKGREEEDIPPSSPDSNPHKDRIHKLINECNIKKYSIFDLDIVFSYIGVVEIEVIEAAVKKGSGKESLNYAIRTLEGMIKDGITTKEQVLPQPKVGENVETFNRQTRKGQAAGTTSQSTESAGETKSGWQRTVGNAKYIDQMRKVP